ncbi:MAG: hypothetical protein BGO70_06930 [Bacteroidetes bacterium 43-93]|nr:AAA family ATPase [Bacteroidota bacterium]OJW97516.1 MAG: hypothetical protein BGO70_06930 [Bacteroidetes bacterium 43-93]
MIRTIDINKFGQFEDFNWIKELNRGPRFEKINILYGRNYSGKTTLSRIFRSIEKKEVHPNYAREAKFKISFDDGSSIDEKEVALKSTAHIRVYNSDFIKENLSWLYNPDGSIQPFTILGDTNVAIEEKINEIVDRLGSIEGKKGLLFEQNQILEDFKNKTEGKNGKQHELDQALSEKARNIKHNPGLYDSVNYTHPKISADINAAKSQGVLSNVELENKKKLLKEDTKENIGRIQEPQTKLSEYIIKTKELLSAKIKPTKPINELLEDSLLQEWVRQGIDKHKSIRKSCAFCGNVISQDLWKKLDDHFSTESENLRTDIENTIKRLNAGKKNLENFISIPREKFYNIYFDDVEIAIAKWQNAKQNYLSCIDDLINVLEDKKNDIFNVKTIEIRDSYSEPLIQAIKQINYLIDQNNLKGTTLAKEQRQARLELRLSEVAKFLKEIGYEKRVVELTTAEAAIKVVEKKLSDINGFIQQLNNQKKLFEAQLKDESRGAELVNKYLQRFFGHDEIKLKATDNDAKIKFQVTRDGSDVQNLSEGECSLISFCYFIARIEDDLKDDAIKEKLVVYIDDPISSLDNNHIFFMFSLIDSVLAKPKKYGQLFISTHNMDFFKYIKRLTSFEGKDSVAFFLIERKQKQNHKRSFIKNMPEHLKEYVTEFNYLFKEIYTVYEEVKGDKKKKFDNTFNNFYNLPNNMRKFLECYLFYKYPNNNNPLSNLDKLFDDNIPSLVNRVVNEYSHLTYIDRAWHPIDVNEAEECAKIIIEAIKRSDPNQYSALCESIGVATN